jgi:isopenicillin-N epimerase
VRQKIGALPGLKLATPEHASGTMTAFELPSGTAPQALRDRLWERHRIEAPIIERPERLLVRVSTHFYNTEEQIDKLAGALREADA